MYVHTYIHIVPLRFSVGCQCAFKYEEEDTCMSYEEEDTCTIRMYDVCVCVSECVCVCVCVHVCVCVCV